MASSYGLHTVTSGETAFNKLTVSCWFKGMADGTQRNFWGIYDNTSSGRFFTLYYSTNGSLYGYWKQNEGTFFTLGTTQKFRDPNAWTHFVMTMDTTLATASDRVKFYVNGERVTSFEDSLDTASPFTQNATCNILSNTDGRMQWGGGKVSGTQYYWDGLMSHCHMCVGYAYDADEFGETDSTTGQWKIKTSPSVSWGTNGGWWFKDGSQLTDSSTNSNTLTSSGTLTNTEDCPSNVFPVLNRLNAQASGYTFDGLGSLSVTGNTGDAWRTMYATFGASSGKYYWEQKITNFTGSEPHYIGIVSDDQMSNSNIDQATTSRGYFYTPYGDARNNNSQSSYGDSWTTGDIIGIALDLDNSKIFFSKNGVFQNSGDPANGTNPAFTITSGYTYIPATSTYYNLNRYDMNFGNGAFGSQQLTGTTYQGSGNIGIFKYQPPTGFTALSTKGLNQ